MRPLAICSVLAVALGIVSADHVAAKRRGLELHPDKTKIVCNLTKRRGRWGVSHAQVLDMKIEILLYFSSVKYLGRMITFSQGNAREIHNRIACAWKRFMSMRDELMGKQYSLKQSLRVFDMTVSATMLYGTATWTLTNQLENKIRRTQRKMMRMMVQTRRKIVQQCEGEIILESWVDWIKRVTREAETWVQRFNVRDWAQCHRAITTVAA